MRTIPRIVLLCLLCCAVLFPAGAATYTLEDGSTIIGDPLLSTASDAGVKIRQADGTYKDVSWGSFSQPDLKTFMQNEKLTEFIEPFIIVSAEDKARLTEVPIKEVSRLSRPDKGSVIGSLFGSGIGWVVVLLVLAANIFAGYEIALFRARNVWLVAGLAAIPFAGFVSNIVWLSLPTYIEKEPEPTPEELAHAEEMRPEFKVPLAGEIEAAQAAAEGRDLSVPKDEVFARGKFTFNKRFFETRFADFFGTVRRGEQKFQFMVIKTPKALIVADRITRVTATDLHVNAIKGASGEVGVSFGDLQEVRLTAKA
ncbi:MAG: hypothetical protein MUE94_05965 [Verrucomicrobia bacterium]|jgi:hypothetical protein|nr:hypothetical protein [Verrucomicrobiota bacterium]